jgi:UDP-2-acetamido-3-amino-2,3-dideoxy-glucuronate N-acetyltransferase
MKMKIAVVGAGYWGKNLIRNFDQLGVLYAICEINPENPNINPYREVKLYASFYKLLKDNKVDAVAIATPAVTHYQFVKQALLSGKDVFVEKPLALTVKEGEELVELAEREGRILMVGHILQYHPAVRKLKEMISSGEIGKIQYVYSNRLNIGKLRTEENILWSFAPHDISVILMLLEEEPIRVSAMGGDYLNNEIYDTTLTTLEFKNGIKGHIFVSWLHPYKEQKLIVVGSKAMAVFDDVSKEKLFLYPHRIEWKDGKIPIARKAEHQVVPVEAGEPLNLELSHFVECVKHRNRPRTDGAEGLRVLKILEQAEEVMAPSSLNARTNQSIASPPSIFIHESAYVDNDVKIGEGTKVWHFSHILRGSSIGEKSIIGQNVMIGPDVTIGNRCKVQNNVSIYKGVVLEDEVFCGPSCVFTNVYNPRAFIERKNEFKPTLIKRGTTIGANATIVCGATIGKYAMIGAGAVVKSDVQNYAIVAGVPAKQIGWACKCGTTLKFNDKKAVCGYCGHKYALKNNDILPIEEGINNETNPNARSEA